MFKSANENIFIRNEETEKSFREEFKNYLNIDEIVQAYKSFNQNYPFSKYEVSKPVGRMFALIKAHLDYLYFIDEVSTRTLLNKNDIKLFRDIKFKHIQLIESNKRNLINNGINVKFTKRTKTVVD